MHFFKQNNNKKQKKTAEANDKNWKWTAASASDSLDWMGGNCHPLPLAPPPPPPSFYNSVYTRGVHTAHVHPTVHQIIILILPSQESEEADKKKGDRVSFHDQRVIAYENRLRMYSTPDKLFRLFATLNITSEVSQSSVLSRSMVGVLEVQCKILAGLGL